MVHRAWQVLVLACVLAGAGCKGKRDGDPTKVTVSSTDDATKPILDEDYRFELKWPGRGWKLLGPRDAARFVPDAVAGAMREGMFAVVIAEAAPGATLQGYVDLLIEQFPALDKRVETREETRYAGQDAIRYVLTGTINGVQTRYVNHVFLHDGHGYQVLGWGAQGALSPSGHELAPVFDAFTIVPGKVVGRVRGPVIENAQGVGWRVKDGLFESAVTGFRVQVPAPWRLMVGEELSRANAEAEVGLQRVNPDVYIVLIPESAPAPELRPTYIERVRSVIQGERGAPHTSTFVGDPLEMVSIVSERGLQIEYLHGVDFRDRRMTQVLAWFHNKDRERALEALQTGLDAIQVMAPSDAAKLTAELEQQRDTQVQIGRDHALRGGVYRSFANGWRWTKPAGLWRIQTGDEARASHPEAELIIVDPARNVYGMVIPDRSDESGDRYHELVLANYVGKRGETRRRGEVAITDVDMDVDGIQLVYRIATRVHDGKALQMLFWADGAVMTEHGAIVDAAIDGFEFDKTLARVTRDGGEYQDHRLGFAVRVPGADYRFADQSAGDVEAIATFVTWTKSKNRMIGVVAVHLAVPNADEAWFLDLMEQTIRDGVSAHALGRATRSETTLGGLPARRLAWPGLQAYVTMRDGVVYGWLSTTGSGSPSDFRLLD